MLKLTVSQLIPENSLESLTNKFTQSAEYKPDKYNSHRPKLQSLTGDQNA